MFRKFLFINTSRKAVTWEVILTVSLKHEKVIFRKIKGGHGCFEIGSGGSIKRGGEGL